jgi:predicted RNA binding protein YcfA (HicA-like mRNA interferase family)
VSKKDKLLSRLFANPVPKNFSWEDLINVMSHQGFINHCDGGSHYIFEHVETGKRLCVSKTHPSGLLKSYQVKAVKEVLETLGVKNGNE